MNDGNIVVIAPLKTIAPECSTTDSGAIRHAFAIVVAYIARMKCVCWMPFGRPVVPDVYISVSRSSACRTSVDATITFGGASNRSDASPVAVNSGDSGTMTAPSFAQDQ